MATTVHPHERGEDEPAPRKLHVAVGSPPRAWGRRSLRARLRRVSTVHPHERGEDCLRVGAASSTSGSPPRAWGRPTARTSARWSSTVHPHERGEDSGVTTAAAHLLGSPPRAWGRQRVGAEPVPDMRFTPTSVGKTRGTRESPRVGSVHPHERGEDEFWLLPGAEIVRFTPTSVGKTSAPRSSLRRPPVHPHERGEDRAATACAVAVSGSPPRAWGRRLH